MKTQGSAPPLLIPSVWNYMTLHESGVSGDGVTSSKSTLHQGPVRSALALAPVLGPGFIAVKYVSWGTHIHKDVYIVHNITFVLCVIYLLLLSLLLLSCISSLLLYSCLSYFDVSLSFLPPFFLLSSLGRGATNMPNIVYIFKIKLLSKERGWWRAEKNKKEIFIFRHISLFTFLYIFRAAQYSISFLILFLIWLS